MAEATPNIGIRVEIERVEVAQEGGPNAIKLSVGNGVLVNVISPEIPTNTSLRLNIAQFTGLLSYIGLIRAGVDTSTIETDLATLLAAS